MQKIVFALILVYVFLNSQATAQPYNFINYEENAIIQPTRESMKAFFTSLRDLDMYKSRKVNIVHIGDSHIQADFFSGRIRQLFQQDDRFANGGRGFVFPYRLAQTNNPPNYTVTYTGYWDNAKSVKRTDNAQWGLAAISATARSPQCSFTINPNNGAVSYAVTKVKIFYPVFDANSFRVTIDIDPKELVSSYLSRNGYVEFQFRNPQSQITVKLEQTSHRQNQFVLQGISLENDQAGVVYHAVGINGATVSTYFRCQDFDTHLRALSPDLVIVSLGTNDAHVVRFNPEDYKNNMRFLVQQIRRAVPQASVLLTTPADAYMGKRRANPHNELAKEKILELTQELNVGCWDFFNVMGGFKSVDKWLKNQLVTKDRLHFTTKGYQLQGELLYDAFDNAYRQYWNLK